VDSGSDVGLDGQLNDGAVAYFEASTKGRDSKMVINWILHELLGQLSLRRKPFRENPVSVEQMGGLIDMIRGGIVTGPSGKLLLRHMLDHPSSEAASGLAERLGLLANRGDGVLERLCTQAIAEMPEEADAMRRGFPNVINKLLGRVMKSSKGTADPDSIRRMLQKLLSPS